MAAAGDEPRDAGDESRDAGAVRWVEDCPASLVTRTQELSDAHPGYGIVAQVPSGAIVGANEAAADLLGLTWDQLVGRTSMDSRWSAVSERGQPLIGEEHPAMVALATGQSVSGFLMGVLTPVDVGDLGRTLARTRWIEIDSHPVFDDSGAIVGAATRFADASTSGRGQAANDAQWAAFHLMIQNTDDVMVRTDAEGVIQWVSLSVDRVLGFTPSELTGRPLADLAHEGDRPALADLQARIRGREDDEPPDRAEFRIAVPDGGWRWVADVASVLRDRDLGLAGEVHSLRDITAEVAARVAMADSEERHRLIAENMSDVVVHFRDEVVVWVSPSVSRVLGGTPASWVGVDIRTLIDPEDYARADPVVDSLDPDGSLVVRVRVQAATGEWHWMDAHVRPYLRADGTADGFIASLRVVDEMVRAEATLARQARIDALTGLANRAEMMGVVRGLVGGERRHGGTVGLLFCDLDGFKEINDRRGHNAGDEVLAVTGERIRHAVRQGDIAGRIGGDEFLVVLNGVHGVADAEAVAEKIRGAVREPIPLPDGTVQVTVSIGVTLVRDGESGDALVERADAAMYEAKRLGGDRVLAG